MKEDIAEPISAGEKASNPSYVENFQSEILMFFFSITLFVLFTWVIPKVMVVFDDMDQAIPLITQLLMSISSFFAHFCADFVLIRLISKQQQ